MAAKSFIFGHPIYHKNGWRYVDNHKLVGSESRKCPRCGRSEVNGQDPCIANTPNVSAACCGHGVSPAFMIEKSDS